MVHINGSLYNDNDALINHDNRGTYYGDSVFETIHCYKGVPIFFEAHYFRLMSSMRIMRMDIPDSFTPEYIESSIIDILNKNHHNDGHARIRFTVWRNTGGFYTPLNNTVSYSISSSLIEGNPFENSTYKTAELFKDYYVSSGLLSTIKSAQKIVNVLAGRYALENDYQEMFLMNDKKMITEGISGNIFLRSGNKVKTPPIIDGCLNGIMREQVINQIKRMINYTIEEESITPFELQRADEIFTTNVIQGIVAISKYRKKEFENSLAVELKEIFSEKLFN